MKKQDDQKPSLNQKNKLTRNHCVVRSLVLLFATPSIH